MILLGIDPGTATTGFGLVRHRNNQTLHISHGVIKTASNQDKAQRLWEIHQDLSSLIEKFKPNHCNVEKLFFQNNIRTAMAVSESRGVILFTLAKYNIPYCEITPLQLKNNLCGDGKADKKQVQKMVKIILSLQEEPKPDDAADALALAIFPSHKLHSF